MQENDTNREVNWAAYIKKIWIAGGIFAFIILSIILFKVVFSVLLLAFASILISIYFYGCAAIITRYTHLSPKLSIIASVILNLLLIVVFFWFVGVRLQSQIDQLSNSLPATIQNAKQQLGSSELGSKALNYINSSGNGSRAKDFIANLFSSGFGALSDLYLVVLMTMFFTASPRLYKRGIIHLLPQKAKDKGDDLSNELKNVLKKWIKGQIIGFFFIAVFTGLGLWILGTPLIFTLALIAGLLNFIPNFGPIIAFIPAALLALMQGPQTALLVVLMYTFIQLIQSAVTQPVIQKKMISMPPALTIMAQVTMGTLCGFWGVLLATPIVAIAMTVVNELYVKKQQYHKYPV